MLDSLAPVEPADSAPDARALRPRARRRRQRQRNDGRRTRRRRARRRRRSPRTRRRRRRRRRRSRRAGRRSRSAHLDQLGLGRRVEVGLGPDSSGLHLGGPGGRNRQAEQRRRPARSRRSPATRATSRTRTPRGAASASGAPAPPSCAAHLQRSADRLVGRVAHRPGTPAGSLRVRSAVDRRQHAADDGDAERAADLAGGVVDRGADAGLVAAAASP